MYGLELYIYDVLMNVSWNWEKKMSSSMLFGKCFAFAL